ncbi:hypothetical protein [Ketobacter sp.]|uniref:hypothetical protein n=1 Tax=Ketobacter sp. TaxID=2083498 RepID=UPI000F234745|nr:hypothetical protein [Ketobacter sp.]RLU01050.1 MAG: hypothetical protein D9N14_03610 [Ketobacter sp.]
MLITRKVNRALSVSAVILGVALATTGSLAQAGARDQAKRMYDRIAGVPPTDTELTAMLAIMDVNDDDITDGEAEAKAAAELALASSGFYNVTLKNMVTPWTNEEQTMFADLNDFTATVIGLVRDGDDFRKVLYDDVLYVGVSGGLPAYSNDNNDHYAALEDSGANLGSESVLQRTSQSSVTGLDSNATAGVMTTRAAAKAYFVAGTNRAMFRFTLMNFMCRDLEQVQDTTRTPDRIRQDVSRSPGGDSRIFLNRCVGCHAGMDPLAQAFAYYNWTGEEGTEEGRLQYTANTVQPKYHINADNFRYGYSTPNNDWINYWREGPNSALGWDAGLPGSGSGAKSMGMELSHSEAFAECQVKQVFQTVCLHEPTTSADHSQVSSMVTNLEASNYNLQTAFTDAAVYCRGD